MQQHSTNKQEIDQLRHVVVRGLADAAVTAISTDLRFQAAYNAVLQLATTAIYCAGYPQSVDAGVHDSGEVIGPVCFASQEKDAVVDFLRRVIGTPTG